MNPKNFSSISYSPILPQSHVNNGSPQINNNNTNVMAQSPYNPYYPTIPQPNYESQSQPFPGQTPFPIFYVPMYLPPPYGYYARNNYNGDFNATNNENKNNNIENGNNNYNNINNADSKMKIKTMEGFNIPFNYSKQNFETKFSNDRGEKKKKL